MIWQKWWFGSFQHQKWKLLQNIQFLAEVDALVIIVSASVESHDSTDNRSLLFGIRVPILITVYTRKFLGMNY